MNVSQFDDLLSGPNRPFLEELYEDYLQDPKKVDELWRNYFETVSQSNGNGTKSTEPRLGLTRGHETPVVPDILLRKTSRTDSGKPGQHNGSVAAQTVLQQDAHRVVQTSDMGSASPVATTPSLTSALHADVSETSSAHLYAVPYTPEKQIVFFDLNDRVLRISCLRNLKIFQGLSDDDIEQIERISEEQCFAPGTFICRENTQGEDLYLILAGYVWVEQQGRFLVELGPGEVMGELSALDNKPRSADIKAFTSVQTLVIRGKELLPLLQVNTNITFNLLKILVGRVRETRDKHDRVAQLVRAFRVYGHRLARVNPLELHDQDKYHYALTLETYGLGPEDLDARFSVRLGHVSAFQPLRHIIAHLKQAYCGAVGVQYMHIDDPNIQEWMRQRLEDPMFHQSLPREKQLRILRKLTDAEVFETFLHTKYLGAKRFSLEGSESLIPLLDEALERAGEHGVEEVVIGMAHRGRLNVLANILEKPAHQIFREFDDSNPQFEGKGDVKYHMGYSSDRVTASGKQVHLSLCFNPSHLEAVAPVALGRVRAKQDRKQDHDHSKVMTVLIHGDAAFIGQGVVQELFNMSELPGYSTGGTVHIIVNNQIGFTTTPEQARSSVYATDIARMLQIPVFHVNGEDPDAVDRVIQIAMDFRKEFRKDIVIDMYGYRKHGHNEGDEPAFTQPLLYKIIGEKPTVREAYVENLLKLGEVQRQEVNDIAEQSRARLEQELRDARNPEKTYTPDMPGQGIWFAYVGGSVVHSVAVHTGVPKPQLCALLQALARWPQHFHPHRKIVRFLETFQQMAQERIPLNWGAAETLAYASLLVEGVPIRLTGQDVERGTFSHRHAVLHDIETGQPYIPLQHLADQQGVFSIHNSPLSETGVLGFEFGYSLDCPHGLTLWEAQFGDFCNMAQVIIDQFISSSEEKWNRLSGLCMLLPHGFEGQGPEHSSARLERFMSMAAQDNMQIVNLTTPAQIFHGLRRQVHNPWRKPLVVMSPKSLLRHPKAVSTLEQLAASQFQTIIPDVLPLDEMAVEQIVLCSGKVYYDLEEERQKKKITNIALLRIEQLYPFPEDTLNRLLSRYHVGIPVVWAQEEPVNMGAWPFMLRRFGHSIGQNARHSLFVESRSESASPATGSKSRHDMEQAELLERAFHIHKT